VSNNSEEEEKIGFADVLKNRNYFYLWLGKNISYFGNGINLIALIWFVFALTGSALDVGILMIFRTIPTIVFGLLSGALIDRANKKAIIIAADFGRGLLVLLLPFVTSVYQIYAIAFFVSTFQQFSTTSRMTLVPSMVKEKQLIVANSLYRVTSMIMDIAGPAAGGVIVGFLGTSTAFVIDAITYFISGTLILAISYKQIQKGIGSLGELLVDVKEGLVYTWNHSVIRYLLILMAMLMFSFGFINVLAIVLVKEFLQVGAEEFGILASFQSFGSLLGAASMGYIAQKIKRGTIISIGIVITGAAIMSLGFYASVALAAVLLFLAGVGLIAISIPATTTIQQASPEEIRGRIMGALMTVINGSVVISMGIAGYLGDTLKVQNVFIIVGVVLLVFSIVSYLFKPEGLDAF